MNKKLSHILHKVQDVLLRYPMVLVMAAIMAVTIVYNVETENKSAGNFTLVKIIITSALGISLMFAVKMLSQRIGKELLWQALGILFLIGFYFILPDEKELFTEVYAFVIIPTFVLSHLMVAFIPFLNHTPEKNFWQYNKNLFVNFVLTAIFTGVLTGGVLLAILSVDQLFAMDIEERYYGETFCMLAIIGSTFIFLLFDESGVEFLEKDGDYPQVLKFFTQFILIPLLIIYSIILYLYSAKILVNWELPKGWVSYLILAYSIIGILALLLVHPLKEQSSKSWVKMFSRIFYFTLIPLIVLLFTAIFTRLLQYGFTEARYFVLLLAVWLLVVVLYFIFIKKSTIKFIPVSLFLFGLFALVFPYFNAFSVAKRSQKFEFEKVLTENSLLKNGKIDFDKKITYAVAYDISNKFEFLNKRVEEDYLQGFLNAEAAKSLKNNDKYNIGHLADLFKNVESGQNEFVEKTLRLYSKQSYYTINDYQYAVSKNLMYRQTKIHNDYFWLRETFGENPILELSLNSNEKVDLLPLIDKLFEKHTILNGEIEANNISLEIDLGKYHIKLFFKDIVKTTSPEGKHRYIIDDALFLIREK
ncbi:DUF4153 domain-containing protein [Flavobacterium sp. GT3R68]|uniref:DUF4153 domain-containing protein n=1 Tax=Flavobacterium sp. GT3R68 TaxID=2594437 RepID=UPI000F880EDA|nr:DUF4153 domain-containing protein [Flavobacterium sp. GT3R68]RTY89128.1 DUF4153 domain-containing protein [Flavobacterium sp. GSN2]TRW90074.1 DUF4153 domain-containing protein [Flavobacterium sp. GT3R68]